MACTDESGRMTYYGRKPCAIDCGSLRAAVTSLVTRGMIVIDADMLESFGNNPPGMHVVLLSTHDGQTTKALAAQRKEKASQ